MKAAVFHKVKDIRVENVEDPSIIDTRDIIVRVTSTAICGSDLHIYNGLFPQTNALVMGHEFIGVVEEAGTHVQLIKKGDRVIVPFPVSCGTCWFCNHAQPVHCENSNIKNYGPEGNMTSQKGGGLFGYTDLYGGYKGGQAEYVRVPYADFGPRRAPDYLDDEQLLFLTDIFPTGYTAIDWANVKGGETVAVFGCGPVGLMAQKVAWLKGASRVIGLDLLDYRLEMARRVCKSETINIKDKNWLEFLRDMTKGRGADVCVDAAGMEADRSFLDKAASIIRVEKGTINALKMACSAARRGGFISIVGVYGYNYDNFPIAQIFDKGLTLKAGQAPVHNYIDELIQWVVDGKIKLDDIITHRLPLSKAAYAYDIFNNKEDNCVKVVLKPFL